MIDYSFDEKILRACHDSIIASLRPATGGIVGASCERRPVRQMETSQGRQCVREKRMTLLAWMGALLQTQLREGLAEFARSRHVADELVAERSRSPRR